MPQECRQHDKRVEVGRALDSFAVAQDQAVDGGPLEAVSPESGEERELDEEQIALTGPAIDPSMQIGEAMAEARELALGLRDTSCSRCKRLDQHDVVVQELRQALR